MHFLNALLTKEGWLNILNYITSRNRKPASFTVPFYIQMLKTVNSFKILDC